MPKNYVKTMLDQMGTAVGKALGTSDRLNNDTSDPDLIAYGQLTPQDFDILKLRLGPDAVLQYVKDMENKKLKGS